MFEVVRRSWNLLTRRQQTKLLLLTGLRSALSIIDVVGITLIGLLVLLAAERSVEIPFLGVVYAEEATVLLLLSGASLLFLAKTVAGALLARKTLHYLAVIETHFSGVIARHIFGRGLGNLRKESASEVQWAVVRSPQIAFSQTLGMATTLVAEGALALVILITFGLTDWVMAVFAVTYFSSVVSIFSALNSRRVGDSGERYAAGSIDADGVILDFISAFREIHTSGSSASFLIRIKKFRAQSARAAAQASFVGALPRLVVETALVFGALGLATFQLLAGGGSASFFALGIFVMGSLRLMSAVLPIQRAAIKLKYEKASAAAAQDQVAASLSPAQSTRNRPVLVQTLARSPSASVGVTIRNLTFSYTNDDGSSHDVLKNLSMDIQPGHSHALVGPSGAGKTTLADLILGIYPAKPGAIEIFKSTRGSVVRNYAARAAYVPQRPGLIAGSVAENICLGGELDKNLLHDAVRSAALQDFINQLPEGLDTNLGKHSDKLSGGQIQRVGLARALYRKPELLVLDEATSALDPETESVVSKNLGLLAGQTTVIIIAHRLSTVRNVDCVSLIENGSITGSGSYSELSNQDNLLRRYLDLGAE